jgi:PDZ domain-containing protein
MCALGGQVLADAIPLVRTPKTPLPMPASDCLAKLGGQRFAASEDMLTAVMSAARGPAAISRTKRAVHLSLCAVPTLLMLVIGLLSVYNVGPRVANPHPHVRSVSAGQAADRAGVQADDVVVGVDGERITFTSQLLDAAAKHPDELITLSILRDGQPLMIRATPTRRGNQGQLGITIANETPDVSGGTWRYFVAAHWSEWRRERPRGRAGCKRWSLTEYFTKYILSPL